MVHQLSPTDRIAPIEGAIHNPSNRQHFMVLKPVAQRVRIYRGETLLADTEDAVRLIEVGIKAYDPIIYVPASDLSHPLERLEHTSHCPLKGEASYFSFRGEEISWSYGQPFDFADGLAGRHAFWPSKVRIVEGQ